jgi:hypothetical protein
MASNSSNWLLFASPIISAVGALLVYHRWIVDHRIKLKDDLIDSLRKDLESESRSRQSLEEKIKLAVNDTDKAYSTLEEFFENIKEGDLAASDVILVRRVIDNFQRLGSLQNRLNNYKVAASKLKSQQPFLTKKASQNAIREFKPSVVEFQDKIPWKSKDNKQKFEADISAYLDWVYDCLYVSGHPNNNPLHNFVTHPSISSFFPYEAAFRYVKDYGDWSTLTLEQSASLIRMIDELLDRLPNEFNV